MTHDIDQTPNFYWFKKKNFDRSRRGGSTTKILSRRVGRTNGTEG
jgi:hypothetical protein